MKFNKFAQIEQSAQSGAFGMNPLPLPTDKQKEAGNYKKGKFSLYGLRIAVEQPANSYRTGTDSNGVAWSCRLAANYGYILGTTGNDNDPIDCFVGEYPQADTVYIINQFVDGDFDEHKIMLCFPSEREAIAAYKTSYKQGWNELQSVVKASVNQFKKWIANGSKSRPVTKTSLPIELNKMQIIQWDANGLPLNTDLSTILYHIRADEDGRGLLLDAVTTDEFNADYSADFIQEDYLDSLSVFYNKLNMTARLIANTMNKVGGDLHCTIAKADEENGIEANPNITKPYKKYGVLNVSLVFALSDAQTITVVLHNPDSTPSKIQAHDMMVAWKWLLNKKDITAVVSPESGKDLAVQEIAKRIMQLAGKNSEAFTKANQNAADTMKAIDDLSTEVNDLGMVLNAKQKELAVVQSDYEDWQISKATAPAPTSTGTQSLGNEVFIDYPIYGNGTYFYLAYADNPNKRVMEVNKKTGYKEEKEFKDTGDDKRDYDRVLAYAKKNGLTVIPDPRKNTIAFVPTHTYDDPDDGTIELMRNEDGEWEDASGDTHTGIDGEVVAIGGDAPVAVVAPDYVPSAENRISQILEAIADLKAGKSYEASSITFEKDGRFVNTIRGGESIAYMEGKFSKDDLISALEGNLPSGTQPTQTIDPVTLSNINASGINAAIKKKAIAYLSANPTSHKIEGISPKSLKAIMESIKAALFAEIKSLSPLFEEDSSESWGVMSLKFNGGNNLNIGVMQNAAYETGYGVKFTTTQSDSNTVLGGSVVNLFDSTQTLEDLKSWGFALPFDLDVKAFVANAIKPVVDEFLSKQGANVPEPTATPEPELPVVETPTNSFDADIEALRGLVGSDEFKPSVNSLLDALEDAGDESYDDVIGEIINQHAAAKVAAAKGA